MPSGPQVMLDLETLGIGNNARILSIGAIKFDTSKPMPEYEDLINASDDWRFHFYVEDTRGDVNLSTVLWWLKQSEGARASQYENATGRRGLSVVANQLVQWVGTLKVWGNGASFDNTILRSAYPGLWAQWNDRCFRTWCHCVGRKVSHRDGIYHNALADAYNQAQLMVDFYLKKGN